MDAVAITAVQQALAGLVAERGLPPKLLIVHQFSEGMIHAKTRLVSLPGVQLVIDADGFGDPAAKIRAYHALVRDQPVEYGGIKLFPNQDRSLMPPQDVLAHVPAPDLEIYQ